jgi:hypothetical protein
MQRFAPISIASGNKLNQCLLWALPSQLTHQADRTDLTVRSAKEQAGHKLAGVHRVHCMPRLQLLSCMALKTSRCPNAMYATCEDARA